MDRRFNVKIFIIQNFNLEIFSQKNYNEESDKVYFFEVDDQYTKKLYELHDDLPFLPERMKTEKVGKLVANLHDKAEYFIQIRNLKQVLNDGLEKSS